MERRNLALIICLVMGIGIASIVLFEAESDFELKEVSASKVRGTTLYVGGSGPGNYTSIQSAIDAASDGDTVFVYSGLYYENVVINKSVDLIGEDKDNTIIDGRNKNHVIRINKDLVTISDFTLLNSTINGTLHLAGIWTDSSYNKIFRCNILNSLYGIRVDSSSYNDISFCTIYSCIESGILIHFSSNYNNITNCTIHTIDDDGINICEGSDNNIVCFCNISNTLDGIYLHNSCENNTIKNCQINTTLHSAIHINGHNKNNLFYNCKIFNITDSGIYFQDYSNYNIFFNCNVSNNGNGILFSNSANNTIASCIIQKNEYGILLIRSNNNIFYNCKIFLSQVFGIKFFKSKANTVVNCHICLNEEAIQMYYSNNNTIYHNNFIDNTQNIFANYSRNNWNTTSQMSYTFNNTEHRNFLGNYWDGYSGIDQNGDGIGDTAYIVGYNEYDYFPLIKTCNYYLPSITFIDDDYNSSTPGWGYNRFDRIQYGVNEVQENGTVYVYNGTYFENVIVTKTINLMGELKETTIIDGQFLDHVLLIKSPNVTVNNFTVRNGPDTLGGIKTNYANNLIISNCNVQNTHAGIWLEYSSNCNIIHCNIYDNDLGMRIWYSSDNNIISKCNVFSNPQYGISVRTAFNVIRDCNIYLNGDGFLPDGKAAIRLVFSSSQNIIVGCTFENNDYGIYCIQTSNNNSVYHNNFINNTVQAYDTRSNKYHYSYPSGGNYWSDFDETSEGAYDNYTGPNQYVFGTDGIVDKGYPSPGLNPYNISGGNNQDNYPFINPLIFMELFEGWNLITVPFNNNWTAETLGQGIPFCSVVIMFNCSTQTFLTHVVGTPHDDFPILDGVGYFIYVTMDSVFSIRDVPIMSINVSIEEEWNIIGWYHDYPTTAESLGQNISGASVVIMFDADTQTFLTHVVGTPHDNFNIERGMGLFIYTDEASVWHGEG